MTKRVLYLILPKLYFYKCQIIQGLHDSFDEDSWSFLKYEV